MDISILATKPLQLYKNSFFKSAHDEYVAKGIGYLIHYLYSGTIFPTPVFKEIKRVDFEIIRKMVFKALDYAENYGYRKHTQEIDDTRHFFGLDGNERIPSYVEIAKIRNLKKVSVVEFNVKRTAARIGEYLQNNCIDIMLTDPNGSNNSIDSKDLLMMIDDIISDLDKMSVVEFNVMKTAARIGEYLQNNCIDIMLTDPNSSNNSINSKDLLMMINDTISGIDIDRILAKVEEMRKKVADS